MSDYRKPVPHERILNALPPERRERILKNGAKLVAEYRPQQLRKALSMTQTEVASLLDVSQASVAEMEKRQDLKFSTLNRYVEALGGKLHLEVEFPDHSSVRLDVTAETGGEGSRN